MQDEAHLVGIGRAARGAIAGQLGLVALDQVLGLAARAVERRLIAARLSRPAPNRFRSGRLEDRPVYLAVSILPCSVTPDEDVCRVQGRLRGRDGLAAGWLFAGWDFPMCRSHFTRY